MSNITEKNILKSWFLRGMKPLESQFAAWMDAYWHKSEQIPTSSIDGLEATLNSKAEAADIRNLTNEFATHRDDNTRHKTAEEQAKLENLANNANLTYATKEEIALLENSAAIIIPVDFTKGTAEMKADMIKSIQPFFDDGTIYKKPVYLQYIYKDDYATPDAPLKYCLVPKTKETRTVILTEYYFNSSVSIPYPEDPEYEDAYCISLRLRKTSVSISLGTYTDDAPVEVIRLIEDGNYVLNAADRNWNKLYDELNKGNRPLLSLKTPESGAYCPVTYEFTPLTPATTPDVSYQGKIEISYLKETDGVMEMWVETRVFSAFNGQASSYDYPHIKKYPCKPDVRVVTEYPTDLSGVADGTIFIKNPGAV